MITDNQARKLMKYLQEKRTLEVAAAKSGMNEKTVIKCQGYVSLDRKVR